MNTRDAQAIPADQSGISEELYAKIEESNTQALSYMFDSIN
jgi:hypothetical protein